MAEYIKAQDSALQAPGTVLEVPSPAMHHVLYLTGGLGLPHYLAYHALAPAQAATLYSQLKRQGRTVWVETADGAHVPMKGSKVSPAKHYTRFARCQVL